MNKEESVTHQDSFVCKACNCTVPKSYCHKTEGYCYLCDPNITLSEALSESHPTTPSLPSDEEGLKAIRTGIMSKHLERIDKHNGVDTFFAYHEAMEEYARTRIAEMERWNDLSVNKPICYQSGNFDGRKSDQLLCKLDNGDCIVAVCYQGKIDGVDFCEFYDKNDIEIKNVTHWKSINP